MNNKQSASSGGIGILGMIQVVFIILKLLGVSPVATWSWGLVLLPLWIELGLIAAIFIIILLIYIKS